MSVLCDYFYFGISNTIYSNTSDRHPFETEDRHPNLRLFVGSLEHHRAISQRFLMFVALEFNSSYVSDGSLKQKWYHPIAKGKSECRGIPSYGVLMRICTD